MQDMRRESHPIKREKEVCKARITELEADLSQLLKERTKSLTESKLNWTGSPSPSIPNVHDSSGADSRNAIDVFSRAAEQQRMLSSTQPENAKLKKSKAERTASHTSGPRNRRSSHISRRSSS
jgi:hypothetical protein